MIDLESALSLIGEYTSALLDNKFDMVWLYRSLILVGVRGYFTNSDDFYLPSRAWGRAALCSSPYPPSRPEPIVRKKFTAKKGLRRGSESSDQLLKSFAAFALVIDI
jgi:hypothetical protein